MSEDVKTCCATLYESDIARLLVGDSFHPGGLRLTRRLGEQLHLGAGLRVLDVASGKGESAIFLAQTFGCEVVGLDFGAENVRESTARAGAVSPLVTFRQGDAEKLDLSGASFDAVLCECGALLSKPLNRARVALITSAGFFSPGQPPFAHSIRYDDCSYREIPLGTLTSSLQIGQTSDAFDHSGIEADRNLALPLDRLQKLSECALIGAAAPRHFSIMGSLLATADLVNQTGPEIAAKLHADAVDVVLVPV